MNKHIAAGVAALLASMGAQAAISVSAGQLPGSFLALTTTNVTGGMVYPTPSPFPFPTTIAAIPVGTSGNWLAAGKASDMQASPATLSLAGLGATALSFLWGSPDTYNSFSVVTSVGGPHLISAADVQNQFGGAGVLPLDGDQTKAYYVTFAANAGEIINAVSFISSDNNGGINAIEISNVTVVPEPEAYGLALAGMGVVAIAMRRRRTS